MSQDLCPLSQIVRPVQARPETTLTLAKAIEREQETVATYVFTDALRTHFEGILRGAASEPTRSWWVQSEYGGGKTHCIAAAAALLSSPDRAIWGHVRDERVRALGEQLMAGSKPYFPVVVSLRGEGQIEGGGQRSLLQVLVRAIEEQVARLAPDVKVTSTDEWLAWYDDRAIPATRQAIAAFVSGETGRTVEDLREEDPDGFADGIAAYLDANSLPYPIAASTREKILRIYEQLCEGPQARYSGLLFVIDEFAFWQQGRTDPQQRAEDEEVLETIAWTLPQDPDRPARIVLLVASQKPNEMTKLKSDRLPTILLLSEDSEDYGVIVAARVRDLDSSYEPELDTYWQYYRQRFAFARDGEEHYFRQVFPFHPLCFDLCRRITVREMESARVGINVFADLLGVSDADAPSPVTDHLLHEARLVEPSDMTRSPNLMAALRTNPSYLDAFESRQTAIDDLDDLEWDGEDERELAERVLDVLFLSHCAYLETERRLSAQDLAEAALVEDGVTTKEDQVLVVLDQLRSLSQVEFTRERGAIFRPTGAGDIRDLLRREFTREKRNVTADDAKRAWRDALFLAADDALGRKTLFGGFQEGKASTCQCDVDHVRYSGQMLVADQWKEEYGHACDSIEDVHFRVVFLTGPTDIETVREQLQDERIAVWVPADLSGPVEEAARDYATLRVLLNRYEGEVSDRAQAARDYFGGERRTEILTDVLNRQVTPYSAGQIITRTGVSLIAASLIGGGASSAAQAVGVALLKAVYTARDELVDWRAIRGTLDNAGCRDVYLGLTRVERQGKQESALDNFAVALGLAEQEAPRVLAPDKCAAFGFIDQRRGDKELKLYELYRDLTKAPYGIPASVVTLWLLIYTRWKQPPVALSLKPDSDVRLASGEAPANGLILASQIPQIGWLRDGPKHLLSLIEAPGVDWNTALPVIRVVWEHAKAVTAQADIEQQEAGLLRELENWREAVPQIRENLGHLRGALEGARELSDDEEQVLALAQTCCDAQNYQEFYDTALAGRTKEEFEELWRVKLNRLRQLSGAATVIITQHRYLLSAEVPTDIGLAMTRNGLLHRLSYQHLASNPSEVTSIREAFDHFKTQYKIAYRKHHRDVTQERRRLSEQLRRQSDAAQAIRRLAALDEYLGDSSEALEAASRLETVQRAMAPCTAWPDDLPDVDETPLCTCGLRLTHPSASTAQVTEVTGWVAAAYRHGINALLTTLRACPAGSPQDPGAMLAKLEDMDLAKHPEKVTDDLVAELMEVLKAAQVITVDGGIGDVIRQRFPTVTEDQIPQVVKAVEEELRDAFAQAKQDAGTHRVQLRW